MFKKIILSFVAIATISLTTFGQAPEGFKYQAVVRDAGNVIVNNQAVGMQIEILQGGIAGTPVYTESFAPTTNNYGLVNLEIGTGSTSDDFTTIDWGSDTYFIRTSIDVTGNTAYVTMGTNQLLSVPYALHAKTAEKTIDCTYNVGDLVPELGGYIIYIDGSGCHGLVAKSTDEPLSYLWSSTNFDSFAFANGIFGGDQNTKKILFKAGVNSSTCPAATQASQPDGGFNDWYLPSREELDLMYVNLHIQGLGGFYSDYYWSSTEEANSNNAWSQDFWNSSVYADPKTVFDYHVRAVRSF